MLMTMCVVCVLKICALGLIVVEPSSIPSAEADTDIAIEKTKRNDNITDKSFLFIKNSSF